VVRVLINLATGVLLFIADPRAESDLALFGFKLLLIIVNLPLLRRLERAIYRAGPEASRRRWWNTAARDCVCCVMGRNDLRRAPARIRVADLCHHSSRRETCRTCTCC
jgi:hypothetical protein